MTLRLHDIDDAERFVRTIVYRAGLGLSWDEEEELGQYLLIECWLLSLAYKPGAASFSTYAGSRLRLRVIDWKRQHDGRTRWSFGDGRVHRRKLPELVSLDGADGDSLGASLHEDQGDAASDWLAPDRGLFDERDRHRDRDFSELGGQAPRPRAG